MSHPVISNKIGPLVLTTQQNGITVIPSRTPLTRLNYFDGKFLRAADLIAEQRYVRELVRLSNKSGGHGPAHGFNVIRGKGDELQIAAGLATNAEGQVMMLPAAVTVSLAELIEKTRQVVSSPKAQPGPIGFTDCTIASETPPSQVLESGDLYVITVAPADAYCGEEDVYGKLCEEACVTSRDRPFVVEGIVLRARPLLLSRPLPVSSSFVFDARHLRSRVASSVFLTEPQRVGSHISANGLESDMWCLGAQADAGTEVPLAVVARAGTAIAFVDAWIVRREKIDTVPRRYWQWRMAMRPWDVFLAHILQFQCQLHELFREVVDANGGGCAPAKQLLAEASDHIDDFARFYERASARLVAVGVEGLSRGLGALSGFQTKLINFRKMFAAPVMDRRLLRGGIMELPSAGYLPVVPGSAATVNTQVRQWMGEGVDLRFCVVRPDYVPHALEEAQHMDRISLTEGLDNPQAKPQVDILVPNGQILEQQNRVTGQGYEAVLAIAAVDTTPDLTAMRVANAGLHLYGAATTQATPAGGAAVYMAGATQLQNTNMVNRFAGAVAGLAGDPEARLNVLRDLGSVARESTGERVSDNPTLMTRLNVLSAEALRFNTARRAVSIDAPPELLDRPFAPSAALAERTAAVWIQGSVAENPFTLHAGDTTSLMMRAALVMPSSKQTSMDFVLRGDLRLTEAPRRVGNRVTVKGNLSAMYSVETVSGGAPAPPNRGNTQLAVEAVVDGDAGLSQISLLHPKAEFRIATKSQGDPRQVRTRVTSRAIKDGRPGEEVLIFESMLTSNEKVLEAGNSSHTAALAALEIMGAGLGDSHFADASARLLFPPPPPTTQDLLVQATLDWVLYHRRRMKTCAEEKVRVGSAARRYQVYHVRVANTEAARLLMTALLENNSAVIQRAGFREAGLVEYAPTTDVLNTPQNVVLFDWTAASPPPSEVYFASIASQGAAVGDGTSLALARLGRWQQTVVSVSPPHAEARYEPLAGVPSALPAAELDGCIAVITLQPEVKVVCHEVLRTVRTVDEVIKIINAVGVKEAIRVEAALSLGEVQFEQHRAVPLGTGLESVRTKWASSGSGVPIAGAVLFNTGDVSETNQERNAQGNAIVGALGATPTLSVGNVQQLGITCGAVTIVQAPLPRVARAFVYVRPASADVINLIPMRVPVLFEFRPDATLAEGLKPDEEAVLRQFQRYESMEFFTREGSPDQLVAKRAEISRRLIEGLGVTVPSSSQIGPLPDKIKALLPPDAAGALDIILLQIRG